MLIDLLVTCECSSHLMLFDIMKLCCSTIYNKQILQRLSIRLKSPFFCRKTLISLLNLALASFWVAFGKE